VHRLAVGRISALNLGGSGECQDLTHADAPCGSPSQTGSSEGVTQMAAKKKAKKKTAKKKK
jgi:hypothetical protein